MNVVIATIEIPYEGDIAIGVYETRELAEAAAKAWFESESYVSSDYYALYRDVTINSPMGGGF